MAETAICESSTNETELEQDKAVVEKSDVQFDVEGHTVYANKTCLGLNSPVLDAMFNTDFKEKTMETIALPGKSAKGFVQFVEATHLSAPITEDNLLEILPIAKEYQCKNILTRCDDFLVQAEFSVFNLAISEQYNLEKSLSKFTESAGKMEVKELKGSEHFDRVSAEVLVQVYELILDRREGLHLKQLREKEEELKAMTEELKCITELDAAKEIRFPIFT